MQEKLKQKNTLSQSEIEKIVHRYVLGYDKWRRMMQDLGSELKSYEDGIMYLIIRNSEKKIVTNYKLVKEITIGWFIRNEELHNAKGFVVFVYKDGELKNIYSELINKSISEYRDEIDEITKERKEKNETTERLLLKKQNNDTIDQDGYDENDDSSFEYHHIIRGRN